MGFDIMSLQKGREPVRARSKADEGRAVLKYIDVDDLVPSEDNFYSMSAIDELAGLIELSGGVKQPGLVVPLGGGKYKVISGHRRRLASIQLVKQGKEAYRKMPCMVEDAGRNAEQDAESDELRAIDEAILLITTNSQREKTDWDKVQEATRLRALLNQKRRMGKVSGETRKLIAEQLGTTPAQVGRYDSIEKHLIPAFKNWLEEGKIGISVAYELSILPKDAQEKAAAECWGKHGPITLEDVRKWKLSAEQEKEGVEEDVPPQSQAHTEKGVANHYPIESEPKKQDAPAKQPEQAEREPRENPEAKTEKATGKIVNFPTMQDLSPVPSSEAELKQDKEPLSREHAACILEGLRISYEAELVSDGKGSKIWKERVDALAMAIAALRMKQG